MNEVFRNSWDILLSFSLVDKKLPLRRNEKNIGLNCSITILLEYFVVSPWIRDISTYDESFIKK